MNATMIKGERSKLLAVAVVIAMVACALVAFMPTADAKDGPLEAADSYIYEDFEYTGERTIVGNEVLMTYPMAYDVQMLEGMNDDFPRFVGALYRADNGATVKSITYNGAEYTWDAEGTLLGSNWVDADGKTLVKAVDDALGDVTTLVTTGGSVELTLRLSVGTTLDMTYTIAAPVASIGNTYYGTLQAAVDAAVNNDTIVLNKGAADENNIIQGDGVVFATKDYAITLDFNTVIYDINGTTVGSTDTETNGFQLLKDNNVTLKNGIVMSTSPTAGIILQNYCNLTLDDFTVDASETPRITYASSNNNGNVIFSGATNILASEGNFAFDVCGYSSYTGVSVTIADDFTGTIDGKVEVTRSSSNTSPVDFNINEDVIIDSIDIQTGNVTIAEGVKVTAKKVTVSSDAVLNNNGTIDAIDYSNEGIEVVVEDGVKVAHVGSADSFKIATADGAFAKVVLEANITIDDTDWIYSGTTVDLAGFNLTYNDNLGIENGAVLNVPAGSTLHIEKVVFRTGEIPADGWLKTEAAILDETGKYIETPASVIEFGQPYDQTFITPGETDPVTLDYTLVVTTETTLNINNADYTAFYMTNTSTKAPVLFGVALNPFYYGKETPLRIDDVTANGYDVKVFTPGYNEPNYQQTMEREDIVNAGYYPDAFLINGSVSSKTGGSAPIAIYVDIVVLPADSNVFFDNNGNTNIAVNQDVVNGVPSIDVTVSGDVIWTGEGYEVTIGADFEGITDESIITGGTVDLEKGTITLVIDDLVNPTPVKVTYDRDGKGTNYAETTYTITFGDLEATLAATIDVVDETQYDEWGLQGYGDKAVTDFYDPGQDPVVFGTPELQTDGSYLIKVTGILLYNESFTYYTSEKSYGWYFPYYIQLPGGFDWSEASVNVTNNTTGTTASLGPYPDAVKDPTGDILPIFMKVGNKGDAVTIEFTFTDNSYSIPKYVLDLSGLEFETVAGYMDNGNAAGDKATETLDGITVDNVVGQTMWMIDNSGKYYDKTLTYGVWYGDTLSDTVDQNAIDDAVYVENGGNYTMWYFSFVDGVLNYQKNEKNNADYVAQPGLYTMKSWYVDTETDEIVVVGTAQAYKTGSNLTGFESYEETAETEIAKDLEGLADSGFTDAAAPSDMRDRTLWMSYFQYGYDSGDYKLVGTLSYGGSVIFTDEKMNDADGNRLFYLSFDDQLAKAGVEAKTGTYTMTVTAYAADDEGLSNPLSIIASATVDIEAEDSAVSFDATEATDIWGTPVSMIQTGIRFSVDDTTDTTIHAYGSVYYLDSFEAYWGADDDKPGYYIAFDIASIADLGGFLWDDAVVTMPDGDAIKIATVGGGEISFTVDGHDGEYVYAKGLDGTFIMYLGDVESFSGKSFEMTVDFDGNVTDDTGKNYNAPFYNSVTYTIDVSNLEPAEPSYNLILSELMNGKTDEYVYENGELVIVPDSQWFTVHNGPNGNYATAYWMPSTYTDGTWAPITDQNKRISADTTIDLAYYDALDGCIDYTVKLYVIYEEKGTTGGAAATSYKVTAALNGNQITIEASNLDGEANADAYFVYVVEFRDAEDNVIGSMTQKFGSALRGDGPTSVSTTYTLKGEISSDYFVDVTLIGVAGSYNVVYGFTTTFLE